MKEILINKQIGSDWFTDGITADFVRGELAGVGAGEEVRLTIDSPGGSIWDCIAIFNVIRDFCRAHENRVTTYVQGMAASAASVIALAAHDVNAENKVLVEDNSIFMIHNAWEVVIGNRNDMRECADAIERIDNLMAAVYSRKIAKKIDDVKKMMDAETWLYGGEILSAGFADEVIEAPSLENEQVLNKGGALAFARARLGEVKQLAKGVSAKNFLGKVAACACLGESGVANISPAPNMGGKKTEDRMKMTAEEFKKDNPEEYERIVAEATKAGADTERARVNRLLKMGEVSGNTELALGFVKDGASASDEAVQDKFFEARAAANALAAQEADEKKIPHLNPPQDGGKDDEVAVMSAFEEAMGA